MAPAPLSVYKLGERIIELRKPVDPRIEILAEVLADKKREKVVANHRQAASYLLADLDAVKPKN